MSKCFSGSKPYIYEDHSASKVRQKMKLFILLFTLGLLNENTLSFKNIHQSQSKFHKNDKYKQEGSDIANVKYNDREANVYAEEVIRRKRHATPSKSTIDKR